MRITNADGLKLGDWILEGTGIKGKFRIAQIVEYKVEEWTEIDLDKGEIKDLKRGVIKKGEGVINVLNDKEIKKVKILKNKLLIAKNLEDNNIIQKEKKYLQ